MDTNTELKLGALHLRLLDHEKQYQTMLEHLLRYASNNEHMAGDVIGALEDGLTNHERAASIENALSSRFIRIEHRDGPVADTETEGHYRVVLGFDDGSEEAVHFDQKQDQLLYILMALCSMKNGLYADFFKKNEKDIKETVGRLIDIIWPNARDNGDFDSIITNLSPDVYFTDIVQKMKAPIERCVKPHGGDDELIWFLPYFHKFGLKCIYQMRILPTNILYPKEFQDIVDSLPDTSQYVDISRLMPNKPLQGFENIDNVQMHAAVLREAEAGDVEAMNIVAGNYNWGTGVMQDTEKAFSWWKKAADLGHAESLYHIGVFYGTGDIVAQDYKTAAEYFRKAADQGYVDAILWLGKFKRHGFGCRRNGRKAVELFEQAAQMGSIEGAKCAAWMLFYGERIDRNFPKALQYYNDLAEKDVEEAYFNIIVSYLKGWGNRKDEDKAWEWMEKGCSKGFGGTYYITGMYLREKQRYDEAYTAFCAAAERGCRLAFHTLAEMNRKQEAGSKTPEEAAEWLLKGMKAGDVKCEDTLWLRYPGKVHAYLRDNDDDGFVEKRSKLIRILDSMRNDNVINYFLDLVDAYREVFRDRYVDEINKQLAIHRPSTEDDGDGDGRRHIVVRRSANKKVAYEIVIILPNGKEIIVDSINVNSLMIYLLAIICSYKSGYSTEMVANEDCRALIAQLFKMVVPGSTDSEAKYFIDAYLDTSSKNNYYKSYSYRATQAIAKAVGTSDDPVYYLFDSITLKNRKKLRKVSLDVSDIALPQELNELASNMPDALILQQPVTQTIAE